MQCVFPRYWRRSIKISNLIRLFSARPNVTTTNFQKRCQKVKTCLVDMTNDGQVFFNILIRILFLMLMKIGKSPYITRITQKRKKFPNTCKYRLINNGRKLLKVGNLLYSQEQGYPQGSYNLIKDSLITSSLASLLSMASLGPLKIHIVPEMEKRLF